MATNPKVQDEPRTTWGAAKTAEFQKQYAAMRKRLRLVHAIIGLTFLVFAVYSAFTRRSPSDLLGVGLKTYAIIYFVLLIGGFYLTYRLNRCPACNNLLTRRRGKDRPERSPGDPVVCRNCGVVLAEKRR